MALKGLIYAFAILICSSGIAVAENEIGIYGIRGITNQDVLVQPLGVGTYLQISQSRILALRLSYSWSMDSDKFIRTINRRSGLADPSDTIRDFWKQEAIINVMELSLLVNLIQNKDLSLAVGPGLGFANHDLDVVGRSTGFKWGGESDFRLVMSLLADFKIAHSRLRPLVFHLFLRERMSSGQANCDDCSRPFTDVIHSTEVAVAVGLRL